MDYVKVERPSSGGGEGGADYSKSRWDLDKQPELEGVFMYKETDIGQFKSNVYVIKSGEDEIRAWGSKVLDDLMSEIPLGSQIKIVYLGTKPTKNGMGKYKAYDLFVANTGDSNNAPTPTEEEKPLSEDEEKKKEDKPAETPEAKEESGEDSVPF